MWALKTLPLAESRFDFGVITLALHKNEGVAFNIPIPQMIILLISVVLIFILIRIFVKELNRTPLVAYGAATITIGALGNLIDRLVNNFTTDYILLFTRSAINLSDIVIIIGVLMIIFATRHKNPQSTIDKT